MAAARSTTAARGGYRRSAARPASRKRRQTRPTPLRIRWDRVGRVAMLVVLAVVLGLYVQQGLAYLSVRSQSEQQQAVVKRLARQNARLAREATSLNQPSTIVREARELGMIKPGERPYVVTGLPGG